MIGKNFHSGVEKQAMEYLHEVRDPEIGLNIVDLGLVYGINMDQLKEEIQITMTLTTQFCPMGTSIVESVEETLKEYIPDYKVKVLLTFDPKWNADMISETGKAFLDR